MPSRMLIIGAGIAGLSAGCYARMNGYDTLIFEAHNKPGGLCTAWKRKDYVIDGCLHWLVGAKPGNSFYNAFEELGAVQGRQMVRHEEFMRIAGPGGKTLIVYTNIDRLAREMLDLSPTDAEVIAEFAEGVHKLTAMQAPPDSTQGTLSMLRQMLKMMPAFGPMGKYNAISIGDFAARFSDPFLRQVFPLMMYDLRDCPVSIMMSTLAGLHSGQAAYPLGGSLPIARAIEQRYKDLGGELRYVTRVESILVEDDRAVGVRLADGSEERADVVLSAADGYWTLFTALGGRYLDERLRDLYAHSPIYQPYVQVSLGVARDMSAEPHSAYHALAEPLIVGGEKVEWLGVRHYSYDPAMAPAGKSVLSVGIPTRYAYWAQLHADREAYKAEKQRVAEAVIGELERLYPGLRAQIEVLDVASPTTYVRYTGNREGAFMAWQQVPGGKFGDKGRTLPGLRGLYMAGQWVETTGGVCSAAWSGRETVRRVCKDGGKRFVTAKP